MRRMSDFKKDDYVKIINQDSFKGRRGTIANVLLNGNNDVLMEDTGQPFVFPAKYLKNICKNCGNRGFIVERVYKNLEPCITEGGLYTTPAEEEVRKKCLECNEKEG